MPTEFNRVILKFLVGSYSHFLKWVSPISALLQFFTFSLFVFHKNHLGNRANKQVETIDKTNSRSIMGRMFGAVSSSVKIGSSGVSYVLDSVQQRTNDAIQNALN